MDSIIFLILRQMRAPLLLLSSVYAIATLGLTLIPGMDDQGQVWYMNFFHAFYFVTFMGTTIGFGEIPYAFTDAQRMWTLIFIYITVATWIYTIGALIRLLQNETLKNVLAEYHFARQVRHISEPFFVVCGYGDTGSQLVGSLRKRLLAATVVDIRQGPIDNLMLAEHPLFVPGLRADASDPRNLLLAGISHPLCRSVVALTDDNAVNLHIAITVKVLNPGMQVICRADAKDIEVNMASFGTDYVIDPFDTFARDLALSIHSPYQYMLNAWFRGESGRLLPDFVQLPEGRWVLCGFGRFGQAIHRELLDEGIKVQVIEPNKSSRNLPVTAIIGNGTEAVTLNQAEITASVGIIAGADDDSNNLSIIVTARDLNPGLFVIGRQNAPTNEALFTYSGAQVVMHSSEVLASRIRTLLTDPLVDAFLSLARAHDDAWARALTEKIRAISPRVVPEVWEVCIDETGAYAVVEAIKAGTKVRIEHLIHDHRDRDVSHPMLALLHSNARGTFCMPSGHTYLGLNDKLLFTGSRHCRGNMQWNLQNETALSYVISGEVTPQTTLGRWFRQRQLRRQQRRR
ncbi:MAG: potassium channel family protein [Pseudomonadales bacterium]|nr:potassium channel family protein [Pseudomonadales bacterium]MDP4911343.1 potassium channel family protein [Pseudomonadales bacterium]MDP5059772.1 potassium channel family protein [Pseudomonadales bacterium]